MKYWIVALVFCSVCYPQAGWTQAGKAVKSLEGASSSRLYEGGLKLPAFQLGNMYLKIPPSVMRAHGLDLQISHLESQLDPTIYSRISAKNDAQILKSLQRFLREYEDFRAHAPQIAAHIDSRVFTEEIPYGSYLPTDLQTLYLGEVHHIPGLAAEVESLIRQLPKIYPNRRIYLATEFLPAYERIPLSMDRTVTRPEEIADLLQGVSRMSTPVLYAALESGIPVIGLEAEWAILKQIMHDTGLYPTEQMYEDYATSFEGMRFRNRIWAQSLRALRQADPDALIVVYAGFGHVGYHRDFTLASKLGGRSFVVLFTVPEYLPLNNPLFRYMRESKTIEQQFNASIEAKLVENWKKNTRLKKIMGSDMTIILHPREEK